MTRASSASPMIPACFFMVTPRFCEWVQGKACRVATPPPALSIAPDRGVHVSCPPLMKYLRRIAMMERKASVERNTSETQIKVEINLDGTGQARFDIGVPFLEHMLDQVARHGLIDMHIECRGDLHIDDHHTVEDVGITLGQAFAKAVGDKKGIRRYGHSYVPMDEALSRVALDFSGRPGLQMHVPFTRAVVGRFDVDLFQE